MTKKQRALLCVEALKKEYPDAICSLTYTDPLQLLIATRLAAQCTDARVNLVTPALFERFPDVEAFASSAAEEVEPYIHSCGLYKNQGARYRQHVRCSEGTLRRRGAGHA